MQQGLLHSPSLCLPPAVTCSCTAALSWGKAGVGTCKALLESLTTTAAVAVTVTAGGTCICYSVLQ